MGSTGTNSAHDHPLRVVVFDNPRSRSHIFTRLWSQHPRLTQIWHPYVMNAFVGPDQIVARLRHDEARQREVMVDLKPMFIQETYGSQTRYLEEKVAEIERSGKSCWINEHCNALLRQDVVFASLDGHKFTPQDLGRNPTYLPDWLFETCTPIIVIRHPVFSVPSYYSVVSEMTLIAPGMEDYDWMTNLYYCRILFDLFKSQGRTPVVADGEDIVRRMREMTTAVSQGIGIDPEGVKETWTPTPMEDRNPNFVIQAFLSTMYDSTGVEQSAEKPEPFNLQKEYAKIEKKYGKEMSDRMRPYVEKNIEHYEYLQQFKV